MAEQQIAFIIDALTLSTCNNKHSHSLEKQLSQKMISIKTYSCLRQYYFW